MTQNSSSISLKPLKNDNFEVISDLKGNSLSGLVIKNNYWFCYNDNLFCDVSGGLSTEA
jgi:hypothetical protein